MDGMLQRKNELDEGGRKVRNACVIKLTTWIRCWCLKSESSVGLNTYCFYFFLPSYIVILIDHVSQYQWFQQPVQVHCSVDPTNRTKKTID